MQILCVFRKYVYKKKFMGQLNNLYISKVESDSYNRLIDSFNSNGYHSVFAPHKDEHWSQYKKEEDRMTVSLLFLFMLYLSTHQF